MNYKYIVTIHQSNGIQIKDMDCSVNDPLELVSEAENAINISDIVPMKDELLHEYKTIMHGGVDTEVDDDEMSSIWHCISFKKLNNSYNIKYDNKTYIFKFHLYNH